MFTLRQRAQGLVEYAVFAASVSTVVAFFVATAVVLTVFAPDMWAPILLFGAVFIVVTALMAGLIFFIARRTLKDGSED